jgi:capsid protein
MRLRERFIRWLLASPSPRQPGEAFGRHRRPSGDSIPDGEGRGERRWEAAKTDRLNQAHWRHASGNTINADLMGKLDTLRSRCEHEIANNPIVAGMVRNYAIDVVGAKGPTISVRSDPGDPAYDKEATDVLREWFRSPEASGRLSYAEMLQVWVRSLWSSGSYVAQLVTDPDRQGPLKVSLDMLHTSRLATPPAMAGDPWVILGVRVNQYLRPRQYYIARPNPANPYSFGTAYQYDPIPADLILHGFETEEAGQVTGVPWLATALPSVADLRDYDVQVLDAARQAADMGIYWYTDALEAEYVQINEVADIERRTQTFGPPKYKPFQLQPGQPSAQYVEYRKERHRDIGAARGVTLMRVRNSAEDQNFSNARFDNSVYDWLMKPTQQILQGRSGIQRIAAEVLREAELAGLTRRRPKRVKVDCLWCGLPHMDAEKEEKAKAIAIASRVASFAEILADDGKTLEDHCDQLVYVNKVLAEKGLPTIDTAPGSLPATASPNSPDETQQQPQEGDGNASTGKNKPQPAKVAARPRAVLPA